MNLIYYLFVLELIFIGTKIIIYEKIIAYENIHRHNLALNLHNTFEGININQQK